nr:MAG TPA_asm: hypothetical protein [Caudoviricetes sp.]
MLLNLPNKLKCKDNKFLLCLEFIRLIKSKFSIYGR